MSDLLSSFRNIAIKDDATNENTDNPVDITTLFDQTLAQIPYSHIVKSDNFSLLQGTHALELLNPKLDTFQLDLVDYDVNQDLQLSQVTAIVAGQLRALSSWLDDNVSIPTSILSSEYVCQVLKNHDITVNKNGLVGIVWKHSALIIAVVKFVIELASRSQIYEEEDLNTSTMNLNWFDELSDSQIKNLTQVDDSTWSELQFDADDAVSTELVSFLKSSFDILHTLIDVKIVLSWEVPLFEVDNKGNQDFKNIFYKKLDKLQDAIAQIKSFSPTLEELTPPTGSFNCNPQINFDNQAPPKPVQIFNLSWGFCLRNLTCMLDDIIDVLKIVKSSTPLEFIEWLRYLENKRNDTNQDSTVEISGLNIVARMLLFAWVRNNSSDPSHDIMFNLQDCHFQTLLWNTLQQFTLQNTAFEKGVESKTNIDAIEQIDYYLENISLLWKEILFTSTLNPCRQRQFKCKELKYWNMRQVETMNLEKYFKQIGFYENSESYPLTFTIIYYKLKSMQEIILKSIEANLYKDVREYLSVYYQLSLISYHLDAHLDRLVKMKKANNADMIYMTYLRHENILIFQIAVAKCRVFELLTHLGYNTMPKNIIAKTLTSEKLLYDLQWKPFNSIQDPKMLTFDAYKSRVTERMVKFEKESLDTLINTEIQTCLTTFNKSFTMCTLLSKKLGWFKELNDVKSLEILELKNEMTKTKQDVDMLLSIITQNQQSKVEIERFTRHKYFPGLTFANK